MYLGKMSINKNVDILAVDIQGWALLAKKKILRSARLRAFSANYEPILVKMVLGQFF